MKTKSILLSILFVAINVFAITPINAQEHSAISLSQDMLASYKMNQPIADFEKEIADFPFDKLVKELNSDLKKQAFWVNVYVTYSQKMMNEIEGGECDKKCKKAKVITVAGRAFSLNDILYKVLLKSKCPFSGMQKLHAPKWEKSLRVAYPDGRVLLAIYGDKDLADAITYYEPENMDNQLNEVSMLFLNKYVFYDIDKNEIYLPKWIKNFKREFGKTAGIYGGLRRSGIIPEVAEPKIIYTDNMPVLK